ncbi:MAG: hypothetical protein M0Z75_08390 [Nitrospiraceae bacterium]|nr:hypothetical protein [Nitrospiraceae bacterium]MDA8091622.1 hypothetical protein [Nitrospiraceae bacterium]
MKNTKPAHKKDHKIKNRMAGWFLERASALVLVLLLAVHFIVIHFHGSGGKIAGINGDFFHGAVFLRLSRPGWWAFYIIFLSAVIYHGFYGLWGIAVEYVKRERKKQKLLGAIRAGLFAVSLLLWVLGIFILVNSQLILANPPALCYKCHARGSIPSSRALRL